MIQIALLFLLVLAGCSTASPDVASDASAPRGGVTPSGPATADFVDAPGVVRTLHLGTGVPLYVVHPDAEPTARFCLTTEALPAELRRDGARVVFTGNREEIPANHRMACAPLELLDIEPS